MSESQPKPRDEIESPEEVSIFIEEPEEGRAEELKTEEDLGEEMDHGLDDFIVEVDIDEFKDIDNEEG